VVAETTLESTVKAWLEKHGYPLEVRVARAFRAAHPLQEFLGFEEAVRQSKSYIDNETEKVREADVVATWWNPIRYEIDQSRTNPRAADWLGIILVIECKRSAVPWIALTSDPVPQIAWRNKLLRSLPIESYDESRLPWEVDQRADTAPLLNWQRQLVHAVVSMSKEDSRRSQPYDAIRQVMSAAQGIVKEVGGAGDLPSTSWVDLVVPVIVTDAPLFECWLDQDDEIQLRRVPVTVWNSRLSKNTYSTSVFIVQEEGVPGFAADCHAMAEHLWGHPSGSGLADLLSDEEDQP
jgi:hypothetical protein